jgi:transcriptional regulator with XRE-family HTH domain
MGGSVTDVDLDVAEKIRRRRLRLGISQKTVAAHLGVSYQQVQKYERGESRIGAACLQKLLILLKFSASDLFDGTKASSHDRAEPNQRLTTMQTQLLNDFDEIHDPTLRASLLHLVAAMAATWSGRRHPRITPDLIKYRASAPPFGAFDVEITNISESGAALTSESVPLLGTIVTIGNTEATVVRILEGGFAVEFVRPIPAEKFGARIIL